MRRLLLPSIALSVAALSGVAGAHDRISTKVTWEREIAPIVQARCVSCHRDGGRAPMALTTYDEVRPWARAIKEEVLTRRMPKWHVVRGYGDFTNDPSLSPFEVALVVAWADGGAPKAPAVLSGTAPAVRPTFTSGVAPAPDVRPVAVPCTATSLPSGRLVGLKPVLAEGQSLRLTVRSSDGLEEPVLWIRDFDPKFPETYWLRNSMAITRGTRIAAEFSGPCTITALFSARTAR